MLADLASDPTLGNRPEVTRLRTSAVKEDFVGWFELPTMLSRMLEADPHNRTAFEYMMAYLMLTGQLELLAAEMARLDELGYTRIPRHWEEALLIFQAATGKSPDLGSQTIHPETLRRFQAFSRTRAMYRPDRLAAARALGPAFGDSYFFYNAFVMGGGGGAPGAGSPDGTR